MSAKRFWLLEPTLAGHEALLGCYDVTTLLVVVATSARKARAAAVATVSPDEEEFWADATCVRCKAIDPLAYAEGAVACREFKAG